MTSYNTDSSLIRKLGSVPSVSVIKRLNCTCSRPASQLWHHVTGCAYRHCSKTHFVPCFYQQTIAKFHLSRDPAFCTEILTDQLSIASGGVDAMAVEVERLKKLAKVREMFCCCCLLLESTCLENCNHLMRMYDTINLCYLLFRIAMKGVRLDLLFKIWS